MIAQKTFTFFIHHAQLPEQVTFEQTMKALGICPTDHVIVYDSSPNGGLAAPRAWLTFKAMGHNNVSVLDGGLNAWKHLLARQGVERMETLAGA